MSEAASQLPCWLLHPASLLARAIVSRHFAGHPKKRTGSGILFLFSGRLDRRSHGLQARLGGG
jgi:hypothetical protein